MPFLKQKWHLRFQNYKVPISEAFDFMPTVIPDGIKFLYPMTWSVKIMGLMADMIPTVAMAMYFLISSQGIRHTNPNSFKISIFKTCA